MYRDSIGYVLWKHVLFMAVIESNSTLIMMEGKGSFGECPTASKGPTSNPQLSNWNGSIASPMGLHSLTYVFQQQPPPAQQHLSVLIHDSITHSTQFTNQQQYPKSPIPTQKRHSLYKIKSFNLNFKPQSLSIVSLNRKILVVVKSVNAFDLLLLGMLLF